MTKIDIHFGIENKPISEFGEYLNYHVNKIVDKGEIAKTGRYAYTPSPYGLGYISVISYDFSRFLGVMVEKITYNLDKFEEYGIHDININIYLDDDAYYLTKENIENIAKLNASVNIIKI